MGGARFKIALVLASFGFVTMSYIGIGSAVDWVLRKEATDAGMVWAHHIEQRIPALPSNRVDGETIDLRDPENRAEIVDFAKTILSSGKIYQIDLFDVDCSCAFSMGSYQTSPSVQGVDRSSDHHGDHSNPSREGNVSLPHTVEVIDVVTNLRDIEFDSATHEGNSQSLHEEAIHGTHGPDGLHGVDTETGQLTLDLHYIEQISQTEGHSIYLISDQSGLQPRNIGEVYHTVGVGGRVDYVIRVLVDLEATATRYFNVLYSAAFVIVLAMLAVFLYPARLLFNSTKRQKAADEKARFLAHHDELTNSYNRNAFLEFGSEFLAESDAVGQAVHLYIFDVNQFKEVNDIFGHQSGDNLLIQFAKHLKAYAGPNGTVFRLGGDEFAIIVVNDGDVKETSDSLSDMPLIFQVDINEGRRTIEASVCGGSVVFPRDGETLQELLKCADLALYEAKSESTPTVVAYREDMGDSFNAELELREDFSRALDAGEIEPHYQPIINMRTGRMDGLEALARWNHPQRGILTPWHFMDMLEDPEMSLRVSDVMFRKVMTDMQIWNQADVDFVRVAVNVGDGDLNQPEFATTLLTRLAEAGLPSKLLKIEVTENCIFGRNKDQLIHQLVLLRQAGCHVALDDFGTGHSSITRIKDLPITALKIDKSFVDDVIDDEKDQAIISALLGLAKNLSFRVVVEGVETTKQRDFLLSMGCEFAQGYLFSKPLEARNIPALIEERNGHGPQVWRKSAS